MTTHRRGFRVVTTATPALLAALALATALAPSAARAQPEIEILNDGFAEGGTAAYQSGFATDEMAAVRLVPPGAGTITRLRFLYGGGTGTRTVTIHLWDDTAGTTDPGAELHTADATVTGAGDAWQELDLTTDAIAFTGPFRFGIEFHDEGPPAVARDETLEYPDRNFIYTGGAWVQSDSLDVEGDWIIRAFARVPEAADADADGDDGGDDVEDVPAEADAGPEVEDEGGSEDLAEDPGTDTPSDGSDVIDAETGGGGCTCTAAGGGSPFGLALLALATATLLTRRRRG